MSTAASQNIQGAVAIENTAIAAPATITAETRMDLRRKRPSILPMTGENAAHDSMATDIHALTSAVCTPKSFAITG